MKHIKYTFKEFEERCREIAKDIKKDKEIKNIFGVPRGGLIPAVRLSHLTNLPLTSTPDYVQTCLVDDCSDSGATKRSFSRFRHYYVLVDKQEEGIGAWIDFWWEERAK